MRMAGIQASMTGSTLLESSWLEPAFLVAASRRAVQLPDAARARMKPWVVGAQARFRVARELRDAESQVVALGLLREAAFFALCALELREPAREIPSRSAAEAWEHFGAPADAPERLALVREAFGAADALSVDLIEPSQANDLRLAAEASVAWLLSLAEIRTPAELTRARLIRVALAVLGFVVIAWGLVAYWFSLLEIAPR